jgi:hypothetical protein
VIIPTIQVYDLDSLSKSLTEGDYQAIFLSCQSRMLHSLALELREQVKKKTLQPDPMILWLIMMMVFSQVRLHHNVILSLL